jgi:DNA-binding MarR family transcriptional regulator
MGLTALEQVAENLMSIQPLLTRTLTKSIKQITCLTPGMMYVMGTIKRHGVMSMSDIGKCQAMPKPHVTVIVDKLIEMDFAERLDDPNDRRIINIKLTEKGIENFESLKSNISKGLKEKLTLLSNDDIQQLVISSQHVRNLLSAILTIE